MAYLLINFISSLIRQSEYARIKQNSLLRYRLKELHAQESPSLWKRRQENGGVYHILCKDLVRELSVIQSLNGSVKKKNHTWNQDCTSTLLSFTVTLLNMFCARRRTNSKNSQHVSADTPIHRPSCPPMSANKLTSWKKMISK